MEKRLLRISSDVRNFLIREKRVTDCTNVFENGNILKHPSCWILWYKASPWLVPLGTPTTGCLRIPWAWPHTAPGSFLSLQVFFKKESSLWPVYVRPSLFTDSLELHGSCLHFNLTMKANAWLKELTEIPIKINQNLSANNTGLKHQGFQGSSDIDYSF